MLMKPINKIQLILLQKNLPTNIYGLYTIESKFCTSENNSKFLFVRFKFMESFEHFVLWYIFRP